MAAPGAAAILTPYVNGGTILPAADDVARIKAKAGTCFITTPPEPKKTKRRKNNPLDKAVLGTVRSIRPMSSTGQIRLRYSENGGWGRGLFGSAAEL
jgi:hypothetical protein